MNNQTDREADWEAVWEAVRLAYEDDRKRLGTRTVRDLLDEIDAARKTIAELREKHRCEEAKD